MNIPKSFFRLFFSVTAVVFLLNFASGVNAQLTYVPITDFELTDTVWEFGRGDGSVIARIKLKPGGKIEGYYHPNEAKWGIEGKEVVFYNESGQPSTRFDSFDKRGGKWTITGRFLLWGNITHVLKEVSGAPGQVYQPAPPPPPAYQPYTPATGYITWDFETGDLRGWMATGDAFNYQPTFGDNPTARHRGQPSNHQGNYWIGGYEKRRTPNDPAGQIQGDGPQGTLTSQPFTLTHPFISFLIGGGCDINAVRVELLIDGQAVMKATGKCTETMERMRWNLGQYTGRSAQIRLIDYSGGGWGHINFDDLRFEY